MCGSSIIRTGDSGFALLPCVCHGEAPLLVDVVVEQHATQQAWRVAGWQPGRDGCGWAAVPARALLLQKVLPQDLHQVLVQAHMLGHGRHSQGVLLCHPATLPTCSLWMLILSTGSQPAPTGEQGNSETPFLSHLHSTLTHRKKKGGRKMEWGRKQKGERAQGRAERAGAGIGSSCQDGCRVVYSVWCGAVWCVEQESKTGREGGKEWLSEWVRERVRKREGWELSAASCCALTASWCFDKDVWATSKCFSVYACVVCWRAHLGMYPTKKIRKLHLGLPGSCSNKQSCFY